MSSAEKENSNKGNHLLADCMCVLCNKWMQMQQTAKINLY